MSTANARRLRRVVIRDGFRCKKCSVIPIYPTTDHILRKVWRNIEVIESKSRCIVIHNYSSRSIQIGLTATTI